MIRVVRNMRRRISYLQVAQMPHASQKLARPPHILARLACLAHVCPPRTPCTLPRLHKVPFCSAHCGFGTSAHVRHVPRRRPRLLAAFSVGQTHTELMGAEHELNELQLALASVGGTKPYWDMEMVRGVVGENVKVALQRTAKRHDDFRLFHDPN